MQQQVPVAQTFFIDDAIAEYYVLGAIVTVVDAKRAHAQVDRHHEAQEQVGFADRIVLFKLDMAPKADLGRLRKRLRRMNPRAPIEPAHFGNAPIGDILDMRGFDLDAILEIEPGCLSEEEHQDNDAVISFVFRADHPLNARKVEEFLNVMIERHGQDMLRYKGVLSIGGQDRRAVPQGVHMMMANDMARRWQKGEKRASKLVFNGRNLPENVFRRGLAEAITD